MNPTYQKRPGTSEFPDELDGLGQPSSDAITDADTADRLRVIADATTALIAYLDTDLRYTFVNSACAQWRGHSPEEFIGKRVPEITGESAYEQIRPHLEASLEGRTDNFEIKIPFSAAGSRYLAAACVPDIDTHGHVRGVVV